MAFDPRVNPEKNSGFTFQGKPITLSKTLGRPHKGLVAMGMKKGIYPETKKIEVVTMYSVTGDAKQVAALTKVPEGTIKNWRRQPWFQELLAEIREENNEKIDAKFNEIIEKSLNLIVDRLDNGDFVVNPKTGELYRKPVNVRDLSLVSAINIDKRQLLRGLPTSRQEVSNSGKLEQLADTFIKLANMNKPKIIDVETVEVIDDNQENKQRLQSRIGEEWTEPRIISDTSRSTETVSTGGVLQTSETGLQEETVTDGIDK